MPVSMDQIKRLREKTGSGMMDVRNALEQADGDEAKAMDILRQKGMATAEKKSARATAEGAVGAVVLNDGKIAALAELNCETDFAAKNDRFQSMVSGIVSQVAQHNPHDVDAALTLAHPEDAGRTLKDLLTDTISAIQENMALRRLVRFEAPENGLISSYVHLGGKMGVLVEVSATKPETAKNPALAQLAKDICLQLAGAGADYVALSEIPSDVIAKETEIEMGKEDLANKPENIRANIVKGRVDKIMAQRVLLMQPFVKDPSKTVQQLLEETGKSLVDTVSIARFARFVLGEGQDHPSEVDACQLAAV